jgi:MFS family permease
MTVLRSDIPARLDRLPWSRWHWRVVIALGVAWVLDGLEVTLVGSIGAVLERPDTLGLTAGEIGLSGSIYVAGAVLGALLFGRLTDRLGRKKLFLVTLVVYTLGTLATAFSPDFAFFALCRFVTGLGIGGEYAAINSAIDELIPARVRGRVNLAINGSFWIGAALGAGLSLVLLDARVIGPVWGWRAGFGLGAVLAVAILLVRRHVPESPRWLIAHGRADEAKRIVDEIEAEVSAQHGPLPAPRSYVDYTAARRESPPMRQVARVLLQHYRQRSVVALALMIAQAFFYNAIFFTYALVLTRFYAVPEASVALYIFPFALGNVLGPLLLGPLFDSVGRRRMIALTYVLAGVGLAFTGWAFMQGWLDARSHGQRGVPARDARDGHRDLLCHRHGRGRLRGAGAVRPADRDRQPRRGDGGLLLRRGAGGGGGAAGLALRGRRRTQAARGGGAAAGLRARRRALRRANRIATRLH